MFELKNTYTSENPDFSAIKETITSYAKNSIILGIDKNNLGPVYSISKVFNAILFKAFSLQPCLLKITIGISSKIILDENEEVNYKELYFAIFDFDINENDTVRLSAATIQQLFQETNYNLKDVRKTKLVKPVKLSLLPNEIKMIEDTKKRNI